MADLRNIQVDAATQLDLVELVAIKKKAGLSATIKEEASKAIRKYVEREKKKLES